ncbi:MAG: DNA-binding protein WhiA [Clostridia bacterium]|nr:DNA-binding protein WhiA [Clostridia bacterium]
MSFAEQLCAELLELPLKKPCCRRALSAGLLLGGERVSGSLVKLRLHREAVAVMAVALLEKTYAKMAQTTVVGYHGHRQWELSLPSPAAAKLTGQLQSEDAELDRLLHLSDCEGCRAAFLRGLFFACGTVNDPGRSSHLEFLLSHPVTEGAVTKELEALGYPPKRIERASGVGLYYKDAGSVGDLITLMGSHNIIFEFYNARIARDIRNNENRATNCVARNIQKSVAAAARQMEAIGRLMGSGKLDALPEPLRETALLRYRNPDATLDELREMHHPSISKSGLSHRLQKLIDAAEE